MLYLNMNKFILLLSVLSVICFSCKDTASPADGRDVKLDGGNAIHVAPKKINPELKAQIDNLRSHAHALIDNRSQGEAAYSMLVVGYWVYEAIYAGSGDGRPKAVEPGYWIKFEDDFSFNYGQYSEVQGGGRYHLTFNTEDDPKLIMVDDNPTKSPEEWAIKTKEDIIIFIGSSYFGNNPKQMKLNKQMQQPT